MTARVPREHSLRFHRHLTLRFDEYERSRFPDTMDILNQLTEDEFRLVTTRIRTLSTLAMMWEDVRDRYDPLVLGLLLDNSQILGKQKSSIEREIPEDEQPGFFGIILRLFGIYLFFKIVQVYINDLFYGPPGPATS